MGRISDLKGETLELLRSNPHFLNWHLIGEFAGTPRSLPVEKPTMAVGVDRVEALPGALGGYLGEAQALSHTGSVAEVTLRFDFWLPRNSDITGVQSLFETLCGILMEELRAAKVGCEPAKADNTSLSTHLCTKAVLTVCLTRGEAVPLIGDIILRRKE